MFQPLVELNDFLKFYQNPVSFESTGAFEQLLASWRMREPDAVRQSLASWEELLDNRRFYMFKCLEVCKLHIGLSASCIMFSFQSHFHLFTNFSAHTSHIHLLLQLFSLNSQHLMDESFDDSQQQGAAAASLSPFDHARRLVMTEAVSQGFRLCHLAVENRCFDAALLHFKASSGLLRLHVLPEEDKAPLSKLEAVNRARIHSRLLRDKVALEQGSARIFKTASRALHACRKLESQGLLQEASEPLAHVAFSLQQYLHTHPDVTDITPLLDDNVQQLGLDLAQQPVARLLGHAFELQDKYLISISTRQDASTLPTGFKVSTSKKRTGHIVFGNAHKRTTKRPNAPLEPGGHALLSPWLNDYTDEEAQQHVVMAKYSLALLNNKELRGADAMHAEDQLLQRLIECIMVGARYVCVQQLFWCCVFLLHCRRIKMISGPAFSNSVSSTSFLSLKYSFTLLFFDFAFEVSSFLQMRTGECTPALPTTSEPAPRQTCPILAL